MGNIGCAVEELIDTVAAVRPDDTAVLALGMLLDDIAVLAEECSGLTSAIAWSKHSLAVSVTRTASGFANALSPM